MLVLFAAGVCLVALWDGFWWTAGETRWWSCPATSSSVAGGGAGAIRLGGGCGREHSARPGSSSPRIIVSGLQQLSLCWSASGKDRRLNPSRTAWSVAARRSQGGVMKRDILLCKVAHRRRPWTLWFRLQELGWAGHFLYRCGISSEKLHATHSHMPKHAT